MTSQTMTNKNLLNSTLSTQSPKFKQLLSSQKGELYRSALGMCRELIRKQGIHTSITMNSAGFQYINNGDAARCKTCGLEISNWTSDMIPFAIHSQRSPTCLFVLSILPSHKMVTLPTVNIEEGPCERPKTDTSVNNFLHNTLVEIDTLKEVRKRTFSHWPHRSSPSSSQMIEAGFFNCNVGDRVICIYCNLICQQWTPNSDDPCEVHKTLSPKCPYVMAMLIPSQTSPISIINEASTSVDPFRCHDIVYTAACNTNFIEIPKRYGSFAIWPNENLPPIDDLVKAGFFFTGTKTIVTCFYCNGSLQNWGPNDNPTIEHARWFPNCAYAKQLCGPELHRKIQESKRAQQERAKSNDSSNRFETSGDSFNQGQLLIPDESTLSRFVAARLDLPISQSLLDRNFKLSIIKRCWEDQLRLKHKDFVSDSDLLMACTILQKQIEHIDGKKDNITVPSVAMKRIRESKQAGNLSAQSSNNDDIEMKTISSESNPDTATSKSSEVMKQNQVDEKLRRRDGSGGPEKNSSSLENLCVLCLEDEKRLACIPCGHLATCVPCGHSLRSCPICRRGIDAFVRIFL